MSQEYCQFDKNGNVLTISGLISKSDQTCRVIESLYKFYQEHRSFAMKCNNAKPKTRKRDKIDVLAEHDMATQTVNTTDVESQTISDDELIKSYQKNTVYVYINSPGGNIMVAFNIYDCLNSIKRLGFNIEVITYGECKSAAVLILLAGTTRLSSPRCDFLIHKTINNFSNIRHDDMIWFCNRAKSIYQDILTEYMKISTVSREELEEIMSAEQILTSTRMMELGFIEDII